MSKIIGIDLGTTNSCFARWNNNSKSAEVLENDSGKRTTPSIVAHTKDGFSVGEQAARQRVINPQNTFYGVKRLIGRRYSDLQNQIKKSAYKIIDRKGDAWVADDSGNEYSPSQISAKVLSKIKKDAESKLGEKVTKAVITVPAYFNDAQRQATKDAGKIAGLEVERIINEPTAAALAYGLDKKEQSGVKIAVYDLGGGTFDVSILELDNGVFEVLSTSGNSTLGGEDFDESIIEYLCNDFKSSYGIDLHNDKQAMQRVKEAAEKAKIELSSTSETEVNLPFITSDSNGPKHMQIKLTRGKLESLVQDLIKQTEQPCTNALKDAGLKASEISEVILVGGMTRMPAVQEQVAKVFSKSVSQLNKNVNPDEVVAMGAAIQGAVITGDTKDVVLLDVTPLSLGIETLGGVFTKLIERNTTIPCKKSQVFSTAENNQSAVTIRVAQGERPMMADNKLLGQFNLEGISPAPRGVPQIEVTFDIDVNGIVHVSAKDKSTNKEQKITIQASGGLSEEEIEKMRKDAEEHAESDNKKKEYVELKSKSELLISSSENALKDNESKVPAELKSEIESAIQNIRDIIAKDNVDTLEELQSGYDKLSEQSMKMGEHVYKQSESEQSTDSSSEGEAKEEKDDSDSSNKS